MIKYIRLESDKICYKLFKHFIRHQIVTKCRRNKHHMDNKKWSLNCDSDCLKKYALDLKLHQMHYIHTIVSIYSEIGGNFIMQKLLELEKSFFRHCCISDRDWLEQTIHNDFVECGKSGILFNKQDTIQSLLECKTDRNIDIYNFNCCKIDDKSWIVHYITIADNGRKYYRTSVWLKNKKLQLYFHQATSLNEDFYLKKTNI